MAKTKKKATDETSGATEAKEPVSKRLSVEQLQRALADLSEGTKERTAWQELTQGEMPREEFRKHWLAVRCAPKKTAEDVKK